MKASTLLEYQQTHETSYKFGGSIILGVLMSLIIPYLFASNQVIGFVDAGIWQLLLISFIAWLISIIISSVVLNWLIKQLRLPKISTIINLFNILSPWEKLKLYFLLFVSLLGSVGLTLIAVI